MPPKSVKSSSKKTEGQSKEGQSSSSSKPMDIDQGFRLLKAHGMIYNRGDLSAIPATVNDAIKEVMSSSFRTMGSASAEIIIQELSENLGSNETSFAIDFWKRLNKNTFVKIESSKIVENDWAFQGLVMKYDQQFALRGPSTLDAQDPKEKTLIDTLPKVQHPKPDMTFGVREKLGTRIFFTADEMNANGKVTDYADISKGILHPFLIMEYANAKPLILCELQALRAGSTLVWSNRVMREKAKMVNLKAPGVDSTSIIFSFCIDPEVAKLFVHFAIVDPKGRTTYHMKEVKRYWPNQKAGLKDLRQDEERILDWGTLNRLNGKGGIKEMLQSIHAPSGSVTTTTTNNADKDDGRNEEDELAQ
ncbi:MAG: hypothetical protein L6R39_001859 [Caloplaca ligustica]|nr:MAG: hypothetical protein L6R39_001859 [Caloplaca ligustica]